MNRKWEEIVIGFCWLMVAFLSLHLMDALFKQPTTNTTAPVIHKTFVSGEGSHYGLVLFFNEQPKLFRVQESLFDEVKRGDHLYITRWQGLISGHTYKTTLYANAGEK